MNQLTSVEQLSLPLNCWRRLSVVAILYNFVRDLVQFARSAVYALPAVAFSWQKLMANLPMVIIGVSGLLLVIMAWGIASYLRFRFKLSEDSIAIRSGVLKRQALDLPFNRIQNVKLVRPFVFRFTGHAVISLDSAGSAGQEAVLSALTEAQALALKEHVMQKRDKSTPSVAPEEEVNEQRVSSKQEPVLMRRGIGDLVLHGLTNNRVWLLLGFMSPFIDDVFRLVEKWLSKQGLLLSQLVESAHIAWWQYTIYAISLFLIVSFIIALLSVGGAIVSLYNYELKKHDDRYVRKSGLFTVHEVSMAHSRLQVVRLSQDWLDCLIGRVNYYYVQNKTGRQAKEGVAAANQILVPSVKLAQSLTLLDEAMPNNSLRNIAFSSISYKYLFSIGLKRIIPVLILYLLFTWIDPEAGLNVMGFAAGVLLIWGGLLYVRWRKWGIAQDNDYVYVKSGLLGRTRRCFKQHKLQQVSIHQTPFMRRHKLATVRFVLASSSVTVPFLPLSMAQQFVDSCLQQVHNTQLSWM